MRLHSAAFVLFCAVTVSSSAFAQSCPVVMQTASRLILVTVPSLTSSAGMLRLFERPREGADWRLVHGAQPVMVGRRGVGWSRAFRDLAGDNEPLKVEGDERTPAGIYPVGRPFGFEPSALANYLQLTFDTVCVEEPSSPAYNTITSRKLVGRSVGKDIMRASSLYRRGLLVDYPTDGADKAGSCIFLHVWRNSSSGTSGCVVMPEKRVVALQEFANKHATVVAIIPESALHRLSDCLPPAVEARASASSASASKP
jgi:L,D-peptidoglycan transpeptidase YkuD (ErfK/YbiS/YcfS/YnhG family)